jgi:hypothetical protein
METEKEDGGIYLILEYINVDTQGNLSVSSIKLPEHKCPH